MFKKSLVLGVAIMFMVMMQIGSAANPFSDAFVSMKVEGQLFSGKVFSKADVKYWNIHVVTKNGIVRLTGHVENPQQRSNMIDLTKGVTGVRGVDARGLVVRPVSAR